MFIYPSLAGVGACPESRTSKSMGLMMVMSTSFPMILLKLDRRSRQENWFQKKWRSRLESLLGGLGIVRTQAPGRVEGSAMRISEPCRGRVLLDVGFGVWDAPQPLSVSTHTCGSNRRITLKLQDPKYAAGGSWRYTACSLVRCF